MITHIKTTLSYATHVSILTIDISTNSQEPASQTYNTIRYQTKCLRSFGKVTESLDSSTILYQMILIQVHAFAHVL